MIKWVLPALACNNHLGSREFRTCILDSRFGQSLFLLGCVYSWHPCDPSVLIAGVYRWYCRFAAADRCLGWHGKLAGPWSAAECFTCLGAVCLCGKLSHPLHCVSYRIMITRTVSCCHYPSHCTEQTQSAWLLFQCRLASVFVFFDRAVLVLTPSLTAPYVKRCEPCCAMSYLGLLSYASVLYAVVVWLKAPQAPSANTEELRNILLITDRNSNIAIQQLMS